MNEESSLACRKSRIKMHHYDCSLLASWPAAFQPAHRGWTGLLGPECTPLGFQLMDCLLIYLVISKPDQQVSHIEVLATSWWKQDSQQVVWCQLCPVAGVGSLGGRLGALGNRLMGPERGGRRPWNTVRSTLLPWDCLFGWRYAECTPYREPLAPRAYGRLLTSHKGFSVGAARFDFPHLLYSLNSHPHPACISCTSKPAGSLPCLYFRNESPGQRRVFFLCLVQASLSLLNPGWLQWPLPQGRVPGFP